ncbi:MAG: phosphoribosylaminoimidazolesuccinocarboxamide synthase [Candidatus Marinimicrobia bacterium]|nr:phosphoribosylaminoimidazolesuccinocarboxamide synthase [Candidatus Neomarinimicrobiota bacterium]
MLSLHEISTPQLKKIHRGKVRDSFRVDAKRRLIVATDRLSSFDMVLNTRIPGKGAVLNSLAAWWFEQTRDIVDNHLIKTIGTNASLVHEAEPVKIEMIVRGYITGSAWRKYEKGIREVSGVPIPSGLKKNDAFPEPILTPTTKEESDREISREQLLAEGWTTEDVYSQMEEISLKLFERGSLELKERGIVLVDTKYEFGIKDGKVVLIDEIHTPDSSRFWSLGDYRKDPEKVEQLDKEFVRAYLMKHKKHGKYPADLPEDIVKETVRRYENIYKMITGKAILHPRRPEHYLASCLEDEGLIRDGFTAIVMGSESDLPHAEKMKKIIESYDIACNLRIMSAHKNGEAILGLAEEYNHALEPVAVIAVAGRSNGLGGALAANLSCPVISCPPFSDKTDMMVNINSSLMMPSNTPAATVVDPKNAAYLALRALNLHRLKEVFSDEIIGIKEKLKEADRGVRNQD